MSARTNPYWSTTLRSEAYGPSQERQQATRPSNRLPQASVPLWSSDLRSQTSPPSIPKINGPIFTEFLHQLKYRYRRLILLIDRAPWHRSKLVKTFLDENHSWLHVLYFPANAPEMNPVEECWRQMKNDVVGSTFHPTFQQLKSALTKYLRTKHYKHNIFKYLSQ